MTRSRRVFWIVGGGAASLLALFGLATLHPGVRYVAEAAGWQLSLLWGRVPVEQAIEAGHFSPTEVARLRQVPGIKAYAQKLGLADTGHYSTIHPTWKQTVWNVSACQELAFEPRTWWFPIVGRVPYLGYFLESGAREQERALQAEGLDVYVRTAGAWSTLGWFEDPLLPAMASWDESRLANTLFHELTHATTWIPGSVAFNESLANFVGEEATIRYLGDRYGESSPQVAAERARRADRDVYLRLLTTVYRDLDAVYHDVDVPAEEKRRQKQNMLDGIPARARDAGFSDPARWESFLAAEPWNNARLVQFRVYNRSPAWFSTLLEAESGDLKAFLSRVTAVTRGAADPYRAIGQAAGVPAAELDEALLR
jgi:predicted aminopeptidase